MQVARPRTPSGHRDINRFALDACGFVPGCGRRSSSLSEVTNSRFNSLQVLGKLCSRFLGHVANLLSLSGEFALATDISSFYVFDLYDQLPTLGGRGD